MPGHPFKGPLPNNVMSDCAEENFSWIIKILPKFPGCFALLNCLDFNQNRYLTVEEQNDYVGVTVSSIKDFDNVGKFQAFKMDIVSNAPPIVQLIWENKGQDYYLTINKNV